MRGERKRGTRDEVDPAVSSLRGDAVEQLSTMAWICGPSASYDSGMAGDRAWGFRTRAIHAGGRPDPTTGARAVPIYQTTSFVFEDAADAADLFALQKYGNIYSRIANPTVAAFEERMASLDGGIGAVATASGQSAEFLTASALCRRRRPHRLVGPALRRHPHAARGHAGPLRRRDHVRRRHRPAAFAAALRPNTS